MKINEVISGKTQGVTEAQSAKTGIYQTDVLGAKAYHAKCMEPNCGWESKRFDRIKQAQAAAEKHAKGHFKQGVTEGKDSGYREIEFICVNPKFPDATDPELQKQMFQQLKKIPGVIPLFQGWDDYSQGQMSLSAIYKDRAVRGQILGLAKRLGVKVDLEQSVSDEYVDRAIRGEHEGQQGVAEGAMKDLHIDLQDQQWDAIVGYVINGLKKNMDIGRIELNLYKYAGQEMFDVDQELQDRGFKDIADLADHIRQHNGRYVPPTDFNLGKGVAEGSEQISIQVRKGRSKFATELSVDGKPAGAYQYDADSGRSIAEVYPEYKGKGFGKILVLHAIYAAAKLGMDFVEDESRTAEYDNVLDSLDSNGLAVNDDGYWYVTGEGEHFLKQRLKQGVAENFADGKVKGKSRPGRVKRAGASCAGSVTDLRAKAKKYGGERGKMYHWCANMKSGRKK